jgi:hypothetical protein
MFNPFKKIINFFTTLFNHFQETENETPEFEVPEKWKKKKKQISISEPETTKTTKLKLKPSKPTLPRKYKIKIPYLRRIKKILAGILCLIYSGIGFLSLLINPIFSFIFLAGAFIMLDYLWKLRRKKKKQ